MSPKMIWLLVSEKSMGPVGLGMPGWFWEYKVNGISKNAKSKAEAEAIFLVVLFIIRFEVVQA